MSLLAQAEAIQAEPRSTGNQQAVRTLEIAIADLVQFAEAVEAQFPHLSLNEAAIRKSGQAPDGSGNVVRFAVKQRVPAGNATVYYNGKVVLAGALTVLEWPLAPKPRK